MGQKVRTGIYGKIKTGIEGFQKKKDRLFEKKILTGIKPTGELHLGNYVGAIKPSLELAETKNISSYLFIADSHSLTSYSPPESRKSSIYKVAASWLACGLDPEKTFFYRQSDIPELFELTWILSCLAPKGLMNRAHSYKSKRDQNLQAGKKDLDEGINMGLYNYPILMSADILLFSPDQVPVGGDQKQHLEITRDIAQKANRIYKKELFKIPKALIREENILPGIDGRKMSKSYNNEIPLFLESKDRQKLIRKIKTDSSPAEAPKESKNCLIFQIYRHFADKPEVQSLEKSYKEGISWGEAKDILFEKLEDHFKDKSLIYNDYMKKPEKLERILKQGCDKVRSEASESLREIKDCIGFKNLTGISV